MRRAALLCVVLAPLPGCGTISSYASGCGGLFSGVRQDGDLLGTYGTEVLVAREFRVGTDGWLASSWNSVFVILDLPLSAVADGVFAPIGLALGQGSPEPVGLGCRFAAPRTEWGSVAPLAPDAVEQ